MLIKNLLRPQENDEDLLGLEALYLHRNTNVSC